MSKSSGMGATMEDLVTKEVNLSKPRRVERGV